VSLNILPHTGTECECGNPTFATGSGELYNAPAGSRVSFTGTGIYFRKMPCFTYIDCLGTEKTFFITTAVTKTLTLYCSLFFNPKMAWDPLFSTFFF
jgi:hypothetical protein